MDPSRNKVLPSDFESVSTLIPSASAYYPTSVSEFPNETLPNSIRSSMVNYKPTASVINRIFKSADDDDGESFGLPQKNFLRRSLKTAQKEGFDSHIQRNANKYYKVKSIESEAQFPGISIEETGPNISQTNLIEAIGRPFSSNLAKNLPPDGAELMFSRRVSQLRLDDIKAIGDVNPGRINALTLALKFLYVLIGIVGLVYLSFKIYINLITTPVEYFNYFQSNNFFCKAFYFTASFQPLAVAPYCRYALASLKEVRGYFLRVPFSLTLPVGVALFSVYHLYTVVSDGEESLNAFLEDEMAHFYWAGYEWAHAAHTWIGIQNYYGCCGINNYTDWLTLAETLPESCCKNHGKCTVESEDLHHKGCGKLYKGTNVLIALAFFWLAVILTILEILSVLTMKKLYNNIRDEVYDERSNVYIIGGKYCSLCDMVDSDDEHVERPRRANDSSSNTRNVIKSSAEFTVNSEEITSDDEKYSRASLTRSHKVGIDRY